MPLPRRDFLKSSGVLAAGLAWPATGLLTARAEDAVKLPEGSAPAPVPLPHFPDRLHAFVWRNWSLVPLSRMAEVLRATTAQVREIGTRLGLSKSPEISDDQWRRSYITIIRRNWHLLPYEQLLQLLGWTAEHMAFILREDDFLFIKLGSLKPKCPPLHFAVPDAAAAARATEIAGVLRRSFSGIDSSAPEPLFAFVRDLSDGAGSAPVKTGPVANRSPRFCYSYFALYGDPLLDPASDPYPDGYLSKLAATGVTGVWLQAVLQKLAPFPWISEDDGERTRRLRNLRALAQRAARQGIGIYLYLNEPRAMPVSFFEKHPELKGVTEGAWAALCTSQPEVRHAISSAVAHICRAVPELAGFFSITASENLSNCWSHGNGAQCPRCSKRRPAEVIAEMSSIFLDGIRQAGSKADLIAWDWGWHDDWAEETIRLLPESVALQSVSEWSIPIRRGGVDSVVGEYSISTVGPGPRALRHWEWARQRGLRRMAKIQAGNTWELSAVPYIPALENVARHVAHLKKAGVDGLMLGWTLGGYPSPNLQAACEIAAGPHSDLSVAELVEQTLRKVAVARFGESLAPDVVKAWQAFSKAFSEFPYHGGVVYNAPMQFGPSNLLWPESTNYHATMIGFPYDDLDGWRQIYPADVFVQQFTIMADGFERALEELKKSASGNSANDKQQRALAREIDVASAAAIHFRSTANQARFVQLRRGLDAEKKTTEKIVSELRSIIESEIKLARALWKIQRRDSRIGFEASNQYYFVPADLQEKVLNCTWLLEHWLPGLKT